MLLYNNARAHRCRREALVDAVYLLPIVHGVDEDLAGKEIAWKLAEAMHRHRQNNEVRVTDDIVGCDGASAGSKDLDNQFDALDLTRPGDGHVIPARDCGAGDRGADLSRANDAQA
jgi:hypothetical protein